MSVVINTFPTLTSPQRIAIIGEAPGKDEVEIGRPFQGASGRFLSSLLSLAGINRETCFLGNVCQIRPPNNDIKLFSWDGPEIQLGLSALRKDLERFNPNICVLLGNVPLRAAKAPNHPAPLSKPVVSVSDWRGSLFVSNALDSPFLHRKCIATYHPAYVLRDYSVCQLVKLDLKRAAQQSLDPSLTLPRRDFYIPPPTDDGVLAILTRIEEIRRNRQPIATDIEGYLSMMTMISFAESAYRGFVVPFVRGNGSYWTVSQEATLMRAVAGLLGDPHVPKILQNCLYDHFVLFFGYGIPIRNIQDDTMLKHWEQFCELEKSLALQTSIYTYEPFYKSDRESDDYNIKLDYSCRDSCVTFEVNKSIESTLRTIPASYAHYRFNLCMLDILLYMQVRGIRYDSVRAKERLASALSKRFSLQAEIDTIAGTGYPEKVSKATLLNDIRTSIVRKRSASEFRDFSDLSRHELFLKAALDDNIPQDLHTACSQLIPCFDGTDNLMLSPTLRGQLSTLLGKHLNTRAPSFKDFIYVKLGLPPQFSLKKGEEDRLTTDANALLHLIKKTKHPIARLAYDISSEITHAISLSAPADPDGRIRCGYNIVGTETARITCYTSPTGSGYNLQTTTESDRDLFRADPGCFFGQCDLAGADGWTVAARLASLGETTLLEDYRAGLKPAKILCYMLRHGVGSITNKSREELHALTSEVKKSDWDYFACKIGQHGTCYLMGPRLLANQIFEESEGRVELSERETRDLQNLFKIRYRVAIWHDWMAANLKRSPIFISACGHRRIFFGRTDEILGQALAHEPQVNTTWATNSAALRLWNDPQNRCPNKTLIIEPLHQVHDALCFQFPESQLQFAQSRIPHYFSNPITIGSITLTIPYEGHYGPSWGEQSLGSL